MIGSEAFVSANVGSGTVQEAADWLEYLTATGTTLAEERARNGRPEPYNVIFWGIGNETWGCGGPFTPEEYITELKRHATHYQQLQPKCNHSICICWTRFF
jgi:alpha-L-arabinofuranosidase